MTNGSERIRARQGEQGKASRARTGKAMMSRAIRDSTMKDKCHMVEIERFQGRAACTPHTSEGLTSERSRTLLS
jgi:hypothetical protein